MSWRGWDRDLRAENIKDFESRGGETPGENEWLGTVKNYGFHNLCVAEAKPEAQ
jgi:hypothetical protein